jgi:hypothetical protein
MMLDAGRPEGLTKQDEVFFPWAESVRLWLSASGPDTPGVYNSLISTCRHSDPTSSFFVQAKQEPIGRVVSKRCLLNN